MKKQSFNLALLASILLIATLSIAVINVNAQSQGTINILDSIGGTTNPVAGTHTYNDGESVTITANSDASTFAFLQWIISVDGETITEIDNPTVISVAGGKTVDVQAIFQPIQVSALGYTPTTNPADGIVVVLNAIGGTTTPSPGYYAVSSLEQTKLTAIPENGWQFSHWIISGFPIEGAHGSFPFTATPTDNPYTVGHGEGNRYNYQPVFTPIDNTQPTPTATPTPSVTMGSITTETAIIIALVIVIIITLVAFGLYARRHH